MGSLSSGGSPRIKKGMLTKEKWDQIRELRKEMISLVLQLLLCRKASLFDTGQGSCGSLDEKGPIGLFECLIPDDETVWEGLGGVALLEEMYHWDRL